jgi:hypothetical protein
MDWWHSCTHGFISAAAHILEPFDGLPLESSSFNLLLNTRGIKEMVF